MPLIEGDGTLVAGWRVLMMLVEHEVHHRSQIDTYAGLNGWSPPDIFGMSAEGLAEREDAQRQRLAQRDGIGPSNRASRSRPVPFPRRCDMSVMDDFRMDGHVGVITGGGRGIGEGIAFAMADAGADVVVAARRENDLARVVEGVEARGARGPRRPDRRARPQRHQPAR